MPSTGPFEFLDHPYKIEVETRTQGSVDQSTGAPSAPSDTPQTIDGHVDMNPNISERQIDGFEYHGDAVLYTENDFDVGGDTLFVRVWHSDSSNNPNDFTEFKMDEKLRTYPTVEKHTGVNRFSYGLIKKNVGDQ